VLLSGWELLGYSTLKRVQARLWLVVLPMIILVLASLWLAFRQLTEIVLGMAVLLLSGLCLLVTMALAGWSWNLLNLMALPLILGTGVDYGIFMQLALRRHGGDARLVRHSIGRALLLCGGTAITGFGSLAWSGYAGMASLGKVCAVGIGANVLIAVYLLPAWWRWACASAGDASVIGKDPSNKPAPDAFYCVGLWRIGLALVRILPAWLVNGFSMAVAELHFRWRPQHREIIISNLLPACAGDRHQAWQTGLRLYRNFGRKLADLWRVESGLSEFNWITSPVELEIIKKARDRGRGVLFITMHLGNWEHGGLLMSQINLKLTVLTLAEPDPKLTAMRTASRARWGIDTLIVGQDSFAFVDVIKRLQSGAAIALSIDRSPHRSSAQVELFGQTFNASPSAAELARASGCALLGVTIVRRANGFEAKVLPEFTYDRQALSSREARRELTQHIMRAFEPEIRQHLDQWYQFVPIWPKDGSSQV
jgi:lauroyl/myristoyl acyltransferase